DPHAGPMSQSIRTDWAGASGFANGPRRSVAVVRRARAWTALQLAVAVCAAVALALSAHGCRSVGQHPVTWARLPPRAGAARDWAGVFARPVALRVTAFVTGEVFAGPEILIEPGNPRTPPELRRAR